MLSRVLRSVRSVAVCHADNDALRGDGGSEHLHDGDDPHERADDMGSGAHRCPTAPHALPSIPTPPPPSLAPAAPRE
jgi:hypothetical protein